MDTYALRSVRLHQDGFAERLRHIHPYGRGNTSFDKLDIKVGAKVATIFKASSVIVAAKA